jgi:hypothetical protein
VVHSVNTGEVYHIINVLNYSCHLLLQERGELLPPEYSLDIARKVKEMYCYTCSDIVKVFFYCT